MEYFIADLSFLSHFLGPTSVNGSSCISRIEVEIAVFHDTLVVLMVRKP